MKNFCLKIMLVMTLVLGLGFNTPVMANSITQKQAIEKVIQTYPGKVLKSTVVNRDGKRFYRIRVLRTNGKIITVLVNANTGRMKIE